MRLTFGTERQRKETTHKESYSFDAFGIVNGVLDLFGRSGTMLKRMVMAMVALVMVLGLANVASADLITLQKRTATGVTYAETWDTAMTSYQEPHYNLGGADTLEAPYLVANSSQLRGTALVKFDLGAIPDVAKLATVNSATLLVRANFNGDSSLASVKQLAQDWVEGSGTSLGWKTCNGAQWYTRNSGTIATPTFDAGSGLYYVDSVANLAGGNRVRWTPRNDYNRDKTFTMYTSLADLQSGAPAENRGAYWDETGVEGDANRLWLKGSNEIRWYADSDMWTTVGGTVTGPTHVQSNGPNGDNWTYYWLEFDVTSIVENWLIDGDDNYGFRIQPHTNYTNMRIYSSENASDSLRPQLVLDYTLAVPVAEPGSAMLMLLGTVFGLRRRRR